MQTQTLTASAASVQEFADNHEKRKRKKIYRRGDEERTHTHQKGKKMKEEKGKKNTAITAGDSRRGAHRSGVSEPAGLCHLHPCKMVGVSVTNFIEGASCVGKDAGLGGRTFGLVLPPAAPPPARTMPPVAAT